MGALDSRKVLYSPGRNDECYTPAYAVKALLPWLRHSPLGLSPQDTTIWCPFDTRDSQFVCVLAAAGYTVVYSHIDAGQDFYSYEPPAWDILVSNPPFTNKAGIFTRALSFNKPFALLMSLTWLNDAAPKRLFRERPLQLLMFEERVRFIGMGSKITFSSAYFCCDVLPRQICMDSLKKYEDRP